MADNWIVNVLTNRRQSKSSAGLSCSDGFNRLQLKRLWTVWSLLLHFERITIQVLTLKTQGEGKEFVLRAVLVIDKVMWWLNLAIQNFYFATRQSPPSAVNWNLKGPFLFFVTWKFNPILSVLSAAGTAWLPERLKWRRPWKCRHYWDTFIPLEMFSHTLSAS